MKAKKLLYNLATTLDKQGIPHMFAGGAALLAYGEHNNIADVDVIIGIRPAECNKVLDVITKCGLKIPIEEDELETFLRETWVLPTVDETTNTKVDFVFSNSLLDEEPFKRARYINISGYNIRIISLEDFIAQRVIATENTDGIETILRGYRNKISLERIRDTLREIDDIIDSSFTKKFETIYKEVGIF